jgi:hypothetical protein
MENGQTQTSMHAAAAILRESNFYEAARRRIEHEDNLNVNRLSWLMASQSFLFSAYAVVVNGLVVTAPVQSLYQGQQEVIFRMIPMLGLVSCVSIYIGVIGGVVELRKMVESNLSDDSRPSLIGPLHTRWLGLVAPIVLPLAFIVAWMILCRPLG